MGEGQFGGDGSVNWDIDTTNDKESKFKHEPPSGGNKGRKVSGADETYGPTDFVISVKRPNDMSLEDFKNSVEFVGDHLVVRIPVEDKEKRQVVVGWEKQPVTTATR